MHYKLSLFTIIKEVLITFTGGNWFLTTWLIYYILHPYLNIIIDTVDKDRSKLLIAFIICFLAWSRFYTVGSGVFVSANNIINFISVHLVVGYIKKYCNNISNKILFRISLVSMIFYISRYNFHSKTINYIATKCMLIYIIHENFYFKNYARSGIGVLIDSNNSIDKYINLFLFVIAYFVFSLLFACLYSFIKKLIFDFTYSKIFIEKDQKLRYN